MSGVNISYKGSNIATLSGSATKTLKTSGKYCEGDVVVNYEKPTASELASGTKSITSNGTHDVTGYKDAVVSVGTPDGYIVPSGTKSITSNGTHDVAVYANANVNVPIPNGYIVPSGTKSITTNGTHDVTTYASANVNVPIPSGYIKPSGTKTITGNGTHDVSAYANAVVNVPIPEMPNIKTWLHEVSSDVGAAGSVVVTGDPDVAAHYADADAFAMYIAVGSTLPTSGRFFCFNGNKTISSNSKYGIYTDKSASSNYNSTGALSGSSGEISANSSGQLKIIATGSYKLKAGTYLVVFGWN